MNDSPSSSRNSEDPTADGDSTDTPQSEQSSSLPSAGVRRHPADPVLPSVTTDERDVGWGDDPTDYSDEWYESERPPHHG